MSQAEGKAGVQSLGAGALSPLRLAGAGEVVVSPGSAEFEELVRLGLMFSATNQTAVTTSVGLATTYVGLCLSNPTTSSKDLVLVEASFALSVAPVAIASLHLIGGVSATNVTHTAAVTPQSNYFSGDLGVGKVDSQATIPTPTYLWPLMGGFTAGALPASPQSTYVAHGKWVLPPGSFIAIVGLTAVVGFAGLMWFERPITRLKA